MLIISRTPVRISFFGGGTDYPVFYDSFGGAVLGTTINQYTYISVKTLESDFFDHRIRIAYSKTEHVKEIDQIEHPSIRETLKFKNISTNLDIHIFSDLPAKSGLGSSSSFTVGFLNALYALCGEAIDKQRLAMEACYVEQNLIRENVGSQDQFHAAYGGLNIIEFSKDHIKVRPVKISEENKSLLERSLLIFFTGLTRHASQIVKDQLEEMKACKCDQALLQMMEMVNLAEHYLQTDSGDTLIQHFGELLDSSWSLKQRLSSKITNSEINRYYEIGKKAGAYGGKLCGAGGGGFLLFLAPESRHEKIRHALQNLPEVPFRFEDQGSKIIYTMTGSSRNMARQS